MRGVGSEGRDEGSDVKRRAGPRARARRGGRGRPAAALPVRRFARLPAKRSCCGTRLLRDRDRLHDRTRASARAALRLRGRRVLRSRLLRHAVRARRQRRAAPLPGSSARSARSRAAFAGVPSRSRSSSQHSRCRGTSPRSPPAGHVGVRTSPRTRRSGGLRSRTCTPTSPGYRVEAVDTHGPLAGVYLASAKIPLARGWFRQDNFPFDELPTGTGSPRSRTSAGSGGSEWPTSSSHARRPTTAHAPRSDSCAAAARTCAACSRPTRSRSRGPTAKADHRRPRPAQRAQVPRVAARDPCLARRRVPRRGALGSRTGAPRPAASSGAPTGWSISGPANRAS